MSTQYYFADPALDRKYAEYNRKVEAIKKEVIKMVQDIEIDVDALDIHKDFLLEALRGASIFQPAVAEYDSQIVGTLANTFHWEIANGFHSIDSVKKYMEEHPGHVLMDEYHAPVSIHELEQLILSRSFNLK